MSKRSKAKERKIKPTFWVFCEGKTEQQYIHLLRSLFRVPIEVIPKISGSGINPNYIKKSKSGKPTHEKDKDFFMYDGDVEDVLKKILALKNGIPLISTPSIEIWLVYHIKAIQAFIQQEDCIREIERLDNKPYNKSSFSVALKKQLSENMSLACERAKRSILYKNPSSSVFLLIESLNEVK